MWIIQIGMVGAFSWRKYLKYSEPVPAVSGLCTINMHIQKNGILAQVIVVIKASSQTESWPLFTVFLVSYSLMNQTPITSLGLFKKRQQSTVKHEAWSPSVYYYHHATLLLRLLVGRRAEEGAHSSL